MSRFSRHTRDRDAARAPSSRSRRRRRTARRFIRTLLVVGVACVAVRKLQRRRAFAS